LLTHEVVGPLSLAATSREGDVVDAVVKWSEDFIEQFEPTGDILRLVREYYFPFSPEMLRAVGMPRR
jgi:hypothetical protein